MNFYYVLLAFLVFLSLVLANDAENFLFDIHTLSLIPSAVLLCLQNAAFVGGLSKPLPLLTSSRKGSKTIKRKRRSVSSLFLELGPKLTRRAYRMHEDSFWKLEGILRKYIKRFTRKEGGKKLKYAVNGRIKTSARLAMALRYFAGGDPLDVGPLFGVHPIEVMKSVWAVVDAVNSCSSLNISYPTSHDEQRKIAEGSSLRSSSLLSSNIVSLLFVGWRGGRTCDTTTSSSDAGVKSDEHVLLALNPPSWTIR